MTFTDHSTLVDALPDALVVIDASGRLRHANKATERMFGWSLEEKLGQNGFELVHPDDLDLALLSLLSVAEKEVGSPIELRVRSKTGWRLVELIGAPYEGVDIESGVILTMRDLTERRKWEIAAQNDSQFRALLHNGAAITALVSATGDVESISGAVARQLGYDVEKIIGQPLADLMRVEDAAVMFEALVAARERRDFSADERRVSCEVQVRHKLGHTIPFQLTVVDLIDDPTVNGFVVTGNDVTELHETRVQLVHTASHDALTGLANRTAVRDHLADLLLEPANARKFAVGFVDIDRFKPVNDLFGHEAGDELLVAVAQRLTNSLREGDLVGRFGGDEFVIVAAADGLGDALQMAERLEDRIAEPFTLSCGSVQIYASIGVVTANADSTVESLLTDADAAMYSVKNGRRGTPQNTRRSVTDRRALAEALNRAFELDEFVVHYQPIVDLRDKRTIGHEALVRWQHPEQGLLMPAEFLDVIEELGHEAALGGVVLSKALRDLAAFDETTGLATHMNVNAAAAQLIDPNFPAAVGSMLMNAGIAPERLTIEVSERTILERSTQGPSTSVMAGLQALKNLGVKIAADDFGTGYSSLTHLVSYPIDSLKIDRSFVSGLLTDDHRRTIVASLISLSHGMDLVVVAEGVENQAQSRILGELGCDVAQGFMYGKPMSLHDAVKHQVDRV
ncbi:MAG: EAL domain-containing protein [Actinomycetota bacterium]|nr:EAL domain-containing protein [Actinomycetota bacterium]